MKQKKLFNIISINLFFLLNGCSNPKPTFQDFIGTWISEDGAEITLQKDSTCIYKNIPIGQYPSLVLISIYRRSR